MKSKKYFADCQADGSVWSFVMGFKALVKRISIDSELDESTVEDILLNSQQQVREDYGHLTSMKYKISGEQWSVHVYELSDL